MKQIEILAPAGSLESLYASLNMGADAVYVGSNRFGARAFANNPTVSELEEALTYAHLRKKKIYLTVNTLLNDRELEKELYPMIQPLYEAGLDACIVQDMGVLSFLHENFPDMDLHGSTQMTLFSGEEANLYKSFGMTRYVPARELTIQEIREARQQTDMEIEVFVHGALCYCYSGQCLMSQVIGGRSGNKGMCAQPCRLPLQTEWGTGYFLSTKDSCTLMHIPELVEAGIDSFKIEGRMKKKEYSSYLSYLYRYYVDFYQQQGKEAFEDLVKNKDSRLWKDYKECMELYNRGGFSKSYLFEKDKKDIMYTTKNGHYGRMVGKVVKTGKHQVSFETNTTLHYQDILEFRGKEDEKIYEYTVKNEAASGETVITNIMPGSHIEIGQEVYRTKNTQLLQSIEKQIEESEKKLSLEGVFCGKKGEVSILTIKGNNVEVTVEGPMVQEAGSRPIGEEEIRKPLNQLGNTCYEWKFLDIQIEDNAFLPLGKLKELRRNAIATWEEKATLRRVAQPQKNIEHERKSQTIKAKIVSVATQEQFQEVLKNTEESTWIHVKLENFSPQTWETLTKQLGERKIALSLPRILRGKKWEHFKKSWEHYGNTWNKTNVALWIANSHRMILFGKEHFPEVTAMCEENLYQENDYAKRAYRSLGLWESIPKVYGRTLVMVTEGCLRRTQGLCDRKAETQKIITPKGDKFYVVNHCEYCYNTIYDYKPIQKNLETEWGRIDFTVETAEEVRKVLKKWNF